MRCVHEASLADLANATGEEREMANARVVHAKLAITGLRHRAWSERGSRVAARQALIEQLCGHLRSPNLRDGDTLLFDWALGLLRSWCDFPAGAEATIAA